MSMTPPPPPAGRLRALVLVLGDQLDLDAAAFDGFDAGTDLVWMAEAAEESTHVWSTQPRIAIFLTAMRHFALALREAGRPLRYVALDDPGNRQTLADELRAAVDELRPQAIVMTAPGEWRVLQAVRRVAADTGVTLDLREDRHFHSTVRRFAAHARAHRTLRMEAWYRELRSEHDVLMADGEPVGGRWNFDAENRRAFGVRGPGELPTPQRFEPDAITREVITLVRARFGEHAGALDSFAWPVTRAHALQALAAFIAQRLPSFGRYQDAMWPGEPWLHHSQLSSSLNLKLLNPREVIAAAIEAHAAGAAPLAAVEGFVRQILGWREYVRGVYWTQMPHYLDGNALQAHAPLPAWYWTGATDMACAADAVGQTLAHGYAHHIQRLMVTGLYAMLLGVEPRQVHEWYLAVYVDAVEWVELPNTVGMSQYADGGLMGSKPYAASGKYIERMSSRSLCSGCRYDPSQRSGERACPYTTLYWDFLARHRPLLEANPRMTMPLRHLDRLDDAEWRAIRERVDAIRGGRVS